MVKAKTHSKLSYASEWSYDFHTCIILGKPGNIPACTYIKQTQYTNLRNNDDFYKQ